MKTASLLMLSLAANLGLVGAVMMVRQTAVSNPGAAQITPGDTTTNSRAFKKPAKKRAAATASAMPTAPIPAAKFAWTMVEAAEYKQYVANLRAIECPEETIRDIILADVNKLYAGRKKQLHAKEITANYWEQKQWWQQDQSIWKQDRALDKEKQKLLVELLGVDPQKEQTRLYGGQDYNERMYPFLSEEKRTEVLEVAQKFQDLEPVASHSERAGSEKLREKGFFDPICATKL
jgi:hypothetical protein